MYLMLTVYVPYVDNVHTFRTEVAIVSKFASFALGVLKIVVAFTIDHLLTSHFVQGCFVGLH